jgi:hypothetical protein
MCFPFGIGLPLPFQGRLCQGQIWRRKFPDASKKEIRDFLLIFVNAFAFKDRDKLKFGPEDKVLDIYRALYPKEWMADALEVETLAKSVRKEYDLDLTTIWSETLTLGELFAACSKRS